MDRLFSDLTPGVGAGAGGAGWPVAIVPEATLNLNNLLIFKQTPWNITTFSDIYLGKFRCGQLV